MCVCEVRARAVPKLQACGLKQCNMRVGWCGRLGETNLRQLCKVQIAKEKMRGVFQASLVAQTVKRLPAIWETRVRSLGQEDPLEKERAAHSSPLAWKMLWTDEPGRLQAMKWEPDAHGSQLFYSLCLGCLSVR